MARWWTKPPIIVAVLGILAVIITALLPRTTITQQITGSGSPAVGSAGGNVTITQQPLPPPSVGQSSPAPQAQPSISPQTLPLGPSWWQQPPVIAAMIAAAATLVATIIQKTRAQASSPATPKARRQRP